MADEVNDNIAQLRKAADDGAKARTEAEALKREIAFLKAGVNLDSAVGKMFAKAYDGELDVEMIKQGATEVGAITPPAAPATPEAPAVVHDENQSQERMDLASQAGRPGTIEPGDPFESAMAAFEAARKSGASRDTAAASAFAKIIEAHNAGDGRVNAA
jgi:hypothetical protein